MSFLSVLKAIGHGLEVGVGVAEKVESNPAIQAVETAFLPPGVPKLISVGLTAIAGAQSIAASAAKSTTLTGSQKMAVALAAFEQAYEDHCTELGLPVEPGKAQAILQATYQLLELFPASVPGNQPATIPAASAIQATPATATAQPIAIQPFPTEVPASGAPVVEPPQVSDPGLHNVVPA